MGLKLHNGFQAVWQLPPGRNLLLIKYKNSPKPYKDILYTVPGPLDSIFIHRQLSGFLIYLSGIFGNIWELIAHEAVSIIDSQGKLIIEKNGGQKKIGFIGYLNVVAVFFTV